MKLEDVLKSKEMFQQIVKADPLLLQFAADSVKDSYSVVSEAMRLNVYSLFFASKELQNNEKLLEMLNHRHKQHYHHIEFADKDNLMFTAWLNNRLEYLESV